MTGAKDTRDQFVKGGSCVAENRISHHSKGQAHRDVEWPGAADCPAQEPHKCLQMGAIAADAGLTPEEFKKLL